MVPVRPGDTPHPTLQTTQQPGNDRAANIGRFNMSPAVHSDAMSDSNIDEAKGRAKEAAGALTDNDDLKREGKADQAGAKVKDAANKAADKAGDAVDAVKEKLSGN
jgi:uncharacterized protein YjbJ (UPF0337 family)